MLEMTADEIGVFLHRRETGVLSVCSDGDAYGIPESFGYRDGMLYFELVDRDDSQKLAYLEETETVSFTVYTADSSTSFASVVIRGSLQPVSEDERETATLALASNDQFPSAEVFPEGTKPGAQPYKLVPEEVSGRKGPAFEIEGSSRYRPAVADEEMTTD